jgi:hypothetical protein
VRRISISLALSIFFSFSSLASVDELGPSFEGESQTSLWTDENDFSSETNRGRRVLKRSQRGRTSLKSLPKLNTPPSQVFFIGWIRQTPFLPHFSKSSVYKQINVYRI